MNRNSRLSAKPHSTADSIDAAAPIAIAEIPVGSTTKRPVFGDDGVLLLAANAEITPQVKRLLQSRAAARSIEVALPSGMTCRDETDESQVEHERRIARKRPSVIQTGMYSVSNRGPAVCERITPKNCQDYDLEQRKRLISIHRRNSVALGKMLQTSLAGHFLNGSSIPQMASTYLDELVTDVDNVLTSPTHGMTGDEFPARFLDVALLAMAIGIEMGFDEDNVRKLGICGIVSDWGMIRVPEKIREATRQLTSFEFMEIKKHPVHSFEMLEKVAGLPEAARLVAYQSHESPNGSGYPRGRQKSSIHPFARIIRVADTFTALICPRPYRPPLMRHAAVQCLVRQANEGVVDADAVSALLQVVSLFPVGSFVRLSDETTVRVLRRNGDDYTHPFVKRLRDGQPGRSNGPDEENLVNLAEEGLSVTEVLPAPESDEIPLDGEILYRVGQAT